MTTFELTLIAVLTSTQIVCAVLTIYYGGQVVARLPFREVTRLRIEPGEVLVVHVSSPGLADYMVSRVRAMFEQVFRAAGAEPPPILVVDDTVNIAAMSRHDADILSRSRP